MKVSEYNQMMSYLMRPEPKQMLAEGGRIGFKVGLSAEMKKRIKK